MILQYYVIESATGKHINIEVDAASKKMIWKLPGAAGRPSGTQISFLTSERKVRCQKSEEGVEIVALGATYPGRKRSGLLPTSKASPESKPTLTKQKKYQGIGKAMIAFGIQLSIDANCNGVVVFEAKTDELEQHYIQDFGTSGRISVSDGPKTFMIADQASKDIFSSYLFLKGGNYMKECNKDFDIDFSHVDETMSWLDELLMT